MFRGRRRANLRPRPAPFIALAISVLACAIAPTAADAQDNLLRDNGAEITRWHIDFGGASPNADNVTGAPPCGYVCTDLNDAEIRESSPAESPVKARELHNEIYDARRSFHGPLPPTIPPLELHPVLTAIAAVGAFYTGWWIGNQLNKRLYAVEVPGRLPTDPAAWDVTEWRFVSQGDAITQVNDEHGTDTFVAPADGFVASFKSSTWWESDCESNPGETRDLPNMSWADGASAGILWQHVRHVNNPCQSINTNYGPYWDTDERIHFVAFFVPLPTVGPLPTPLPATREGVPLVEQSGYIYPFGTWPPSLLWPTVEQALIDDLDDPGRYPTLQPWLRWRLDPRCNVNPLLKVPAYVVPAMLTGETEQDYLACLQSLGAIDDTTDVIADTNPELLPTDPQRRPKIKVAVRTCLARTAMASPTRTASRDDCEHLPMFVTGRDVATATDHDAAALAANPTWAKLTSRIVGPNDLWYRGFRETKYGGGAVTPPATDGCKGEIIDGDVMNPNSTACDEFPFWKTAEGGYHAPPDTPHLEIINWSDNSLQGSRLQAFNLACKMERRLTAPPEYGSGSFLALPMPPGSGIDSTSICNGNPPD